MGGRLRHRERKSESKRPPQTTERDILASHNMDQPNYSNEKKKSSTPIFGHLLQNLKQTQSYWKWKKALNTEWSLTTWPERLWTQTWQHREKQTHNTVSWKTQSASLQPAQWQKNQNKTHQKPNTVSDIKSVLTSLHYVEGLQQTIFSSLINPIHWWRKCSHPIFPKEKEGNALLGGNANNWPGWLMIIYKWKM